MKEINDKWSTYYILDKYIILLCWFDPTINFPSSSKINQITIIFQSSINLHHFISLLVLELCPIRLLSPIKASFFFLLYLRNVQDEKWWNYLQIPMLIHSEFMEFPVTFDSYKIEPLMVLQTVESTRCLHFKVLKILITWRYFWRQKDQQFLHFHYQTGWSADLEG